VTFKFVKDRAGIGEISVIASESDVMQKIAEEIAATARELATQEGEDDFATALVVETSVRPKGRGMVEVIARSADAESVEFGDGDLVERRRILGRAAGITLNTK